MKKIYVTLTIAAILWSSLSHAAMLPQEFYVKERWFSMTSTFDIETKTEKLGYVHRKFWSMMPEYQLYSSNDQLLSKARMRFFSLMYVFDITDPYDVPLGRVDNQWAWFFPSWGLYGSQGQLVAEAELNFWGTCYTIKDPITQMTIAKATRPFFHFVNKWTIQITDPVAFERSGLSPDLFLVVLAFQVDFENWRAQQQSHDYINNRSLKSIKTYEQISKQRSEELLVKLEHYSMLIEETEVGAEEFSAIEAYFEESAPYDSCDEGQRLEAFVAAVETALAGDELSDKEKYALLMMVVERVKAPLDSSMSE